MSVMRCVLGEWNASFCTFLIPRSVLTTLLCLTDYSSSQDLFDDSIRGGGEWIHLQNVLQGIDIAALIAAVEGEQIVLKLQPALQAQKQIDVCSRLEQVKGFIRCGTASAVPLGPLTSLATGCSTEYYPNVVAMEYYPNGSLEDYIRHHQTPWTTIVHVLCDVVRNSYRAYTLAGFCHCDLFAKNVLLDKDLTPIITDLEKAEFDCPGQSFWRDMTGFFDDITRHAPKLPNERDLHDVIRQHVVTPRAYNIQPTQDGVDALVHSLLSNA